MISSAILIFALTTTHSFASEVSFNCQATNADGRRYDYLRIAHDGTTIKNLFINTYQLITDGKPIGNNMESSSAFDIKVGELQKRREGVLELDVSLQDYSDVQSWKIDLSDDAHEAAVIETFQSSDGDGLPHVSAVVLNCK
jgi:hypothetical protein